MPREVTTAWVRTAHADAWEAHGRYRADRGGGAAELPGVRLMASGLPYPYWNNADVYDASAVDVEAVAEWYAARGVPWGVRVPAGAQWSHGRLLFRKRLMGVTPETFEPAAVPSGLQIREASPEDIAAVVAVDAAAFEEPPDQQRLWIEPMLSQPGVVVALAELDGRPVGSGNCVVTDTQAGPCVYVAGIAVDPSAQRRGFGAAVSSWLVQQGWDRGARLGHLHPDTDGAAALYRRLGFVEVDGLDIYVDVA